MKHTSRFSIGCGRCLLALCLAVLAPALIHAQEDLWVLPDTGAWIGLGPTGSATDPGLMTVTFQGQILLVPPNAVSDYLQKGGRLGWPQVIVPLMLEGKPIAAPITQVLDLLRKGAQVSDQLVIMHKGNEQIAVLKSQIGEYQAKGYQLGPKEGWIEGALMCFKGQQVVVAQAAVDKYKKEGAETGPCKR